MATRSPSSTLPVAAIELQAVRCGAPSRGLRWIFDRVFAQMSSDRPDAVLTTSDPAHQTQMPEVIDFLLKNCIAGLFQVREHVVAGARVRLVHVQTSIDGSGS
jgi:hypothetical protein